MSDEGQDEELEGERPEYVTCVRHDVGPHFPLPIQRTTWCGRPESEAGFCYQNVDAALYDCMRGGRLLLCPECGEAIRATLARAVDR